MSTPDQQAGVHQTAGENRRPRKIRMSEVHDGHPQKPCFLRNRSFPSPLIEG